MCSCDRHVLFMRDVDRRVAEIANRQGGAITRIQLTGLGVTRGQIQHRVRRGRWDPIRKLGYRILPAESHEDHLLSAIALLPNAVVSHHSAASLHGFPALRKTEPHVSVHSRTTHHFPGVEVHRCHDLADSHVTTVAGLPVTSVERTIVDLAAKLSVKHLAFIVTRLLDQGALVADRLEIVAGSVARKGKPGTRNMRTVLETIEVTGPVSPLEKRGRALLSSHGLAPDRSEFPLPWAPHRRFDDAYPMQKLAIEWDSFRYHGERDAFESDRRRDREAIEHGWRILRFTWRDVNERPDGVVSSVRAAIDLAS